MGTSVGRDRNAPGPPASGSISQTQGRWERDERTLSRSAPGFVVLLGQDGGDPIVLRGTGVALWVALEQPQSTEDLAIRLAAEFDTDRAAVRSDIEPVIARLADAGVLHTLP